MKRLVLTLMVAAATLLGVSAFAPSGVAVAYPPGQSAVIRVNVSSVRTNQPFEVTISPCIPGETVIFRFRDQTETTTCTAAGKASATFTPRVNPSRLEAQALTVDVPAPGPYEVCGRLTGNGVTVPPGTTRPSTLCTQVQVLADAPPTTISNAGGGGLPATGSGGLGTTATSAIVVLSAGVLLLIVAQVRRRRASHAAA